jgi:hypothetical protein
MQPANVTALAAVADSQPRGITPRSVQEAEQLATTLSKSALIPADLRGKPGDVLLILLTGAELGMGPTAALRGVYVVKGRPCISAQMMVGLCQNSPACEYFTLVESTATSATYETKRKGAPKPTTLTWTLEQAKAAGLLSNGTWKAYPAEMLRARCASALARAVYPGEILGLYSKEEIEDIPAEPKSAKAERVRAPEVEAPRVVTPEVVPPAAEQAKAKVREQLERQGADHQAPAAPATREPGSDDVTPEEKAEADALDLVNAARDLPELKANYTKAATLKDVMGGEAWARVTARKDERKAELAGKEGK